MHKILAPLAVAGLALSVSAGALAQDAEQDPLFDTEIGLDTEFNGDEQLLPDDGTEPFEADAPPSFGAGVDTQINYDAVISDIELNGAASADLNALADDAVVQIVTVADIQANITAGTDTTPLDNVLADRAENAPIAASVEQNSVIMSELEAEGYSVEDVVAVTMVADNHVVVVVDADA